MPGAGLQLAIAVMLAQPPTLPAEPPTTVDGVTVTAPRNPAEAVPGFVDELAVPAAHGRVMGQIPRWNKPVCPTVMGASRKVSAYFVQRIGEAARGAGVRMATGRCRPNLIVAVTEEGDRLARELAAKHRYRIFGRGRHAELDAFKRAERPVRWWHLSETGPATGGIGTGQPSMMSENGAATTPSIGLSAPVMPLDPSRIRASTSANTTAVLVVVDAREARGVPPQALSAYVAMVGLARFPQAPDVSGVESILNLFASGGRTPPRDLTRYDRAYLKGLYDMRANTRFARQRQQIETAMRRALTEPEDPAETP